MRKPKQQQLAKLAGVSVRHFLRLRRAGDPRVAEAEATWRKAEAEGGDPSPTKADIAAARRWHASRGRLDDFRKKMRLWGMGK